MISIKVNKFLQSAFSNEQAEILKGEISNYIDKGDKIVLDFDGITKFTTLFLILAQDILLIYLGRKNMIEYLN